MKIKNIIVLIVLVGVLGIVFFLQKDRRFQVVSVEEANQNTFSDTLITDLDTQLKHVFGQDLSFDKYDLTTVMNGVSIDGLKKGQSFKKDILFEDTESECVDSIEISYDAIRERFVLHVYEEFLHEGEDWCWESASTYSFKIMNYQIKDLQLDFYAE